MRHGGVHVGNFFLGEKDGGGEFTDEDEEVLVLFAAQAAIAIANARAHRDERRARADLEALLVEQARTTFLSGGGRQAMRIDLPADLPPVMADERRVAQVLNNLFSNAARHSPESSPIHVGAVRDGIEVAISVTDEGRGIPPERLPHLFRKYADAADREPERAGFGLGLVICKGLVEAHGGRIDNALPGTLAIV